MTHASKYQLATSLRANTCLLPDGAVMRCNPLSLAVEPRDAAADTGTTQSGKFETFYRATKKPHPGDAGCGARSGATTSKYCTGDISRQAGERKSTRWWVEGVTTHLRRKLTRDVRFEKWHRFAQAAAVHGVADWMEARRGVMRLLGRPQNRTRSKKDDATVEKMQWVTPGPAVVAKAGVVSCRTAHRTHTASRSQGRK